MRKTRLFAVLCAVSLVALILGLTGCSDNTEETTISKEQLFTNSVDYLNDASKGVKTFYKTDYGDFFGEPLAITQQVAYNGSFSNVKMYIGPDFDEYPDGNVEYVQQKTGDETIFYTKTENNLWLSSKEQSMQCMNRQQGPK